MASGRRAVPAYIGIVTLAAGLLFAAAVVDARRDGGGDAARQGALAAVLAVAIVLAERFPLHLTHKTKVYVDAAFTTAAVLVLDVPQAMAVAAVAVAVSQALLRDSWEQAVFNTAQTALYVGVGGVLFHALAGRDLPPALPGLGNLPAVLVAAAAMHAVNTLTVATVVALQTGETPLRTWRAGLWLDLPEHLALVASGVLIATVANEEPWALPLFALPLALVWASLRRSIQMREAARASVEFLASIVDLRDPDLADHSKRVAGWAGPLAARLGLTPREVEEVVVAARVHDIGKVGLDPALLLKAGPLDEADWAQIRRHPGDGADLLERLPAYAAAVRMVRHHHERWDGSGYPDGLAGEEIPLGARLIAVAEAYDAMTSGQAGRAARGPEAALRELEAGAGGQWDPRAVAAMTALVRERLGAGVDGHRAPAGRRAEAAAR